jgi:hypothetical protein
MKQDDRFFTIAGCCALLVTVGAFLWFNQAQVFQRRQAPDPRPRLEISSSVPDADRESANPGVRSRLHRRDPVPAIELPNPVVEASYEPDPDVAPWISGSESVDWMRTLIESVAAGETPEIKGLELPGLAEVLVRRDSDGRLVVASGTHRRYRPMIAALAELDTERMTAFLVYLEQLGADDGADDPMLRDRLRAATDHLLQVQIPEVEPDMSSMRTHWGFADADHEKLSTAQKHMLLMGRDNARVLRRALLDIRGVLLDPVEEILPEPEPTTPVEVLVAEAEETTSSDTEIAAP